MGRPMLSYERAPVPRLTSFSTATEYLPASSRQAVQHLTGVRDDERLRVIGERIEVDARRVEIVEVDASDNGLRDARRQGDRHPVDPTVDGVVGPRASEVRRVGKVPPVIPGEALPLGQEVVTAVIAD